MNETLFNNCENGREPDWSLYDGFEIDGVVIEALGDGKRYYEPAHPDEVPDFYSVYAHRKDGGVDAVTDVTTARLARDVVASLMVCSGIRRLNDYTL